MSTFLPIQSELHPGLHIVSAVYQFRCNIEKFDKAFTLHLQHCIELQSSEDCCKMRFIIQHDGNNDMKYGHFEVGNSYGTVSLNKFCNIFIIWILELWRNISTIVLSLLSNEDRHSLQLSSNQPNSSSSEDHSEETSAPQNILTQSPSGQQHDSSVPPGSSTDDLVITYDTTGNKPVYKYEAMIILPKDHCHLTDWSGVYSIYENLIGWKKVCSYIALAMQELIIYVP